VPAHESLDRENCVLWIHYRLALGRLPHQSLTALRERHYRRAKAATFRRGDDDWIATLNNSHHTICRPQINANYLTHLSTLLAGKYTLQV
jgi:hypothetical protein